MNFDQAFEILISPDFEGEYANNPRDPGGETKYGISKRAFPGEDIKNLSKERAALLAKTHYWGPAACDALPPLLRFPVFDFAYHSGTKIAAEVLQRVVKAHPDGVIGPKTLMAVSEHDPLSTALLVSLGRLNFLTDIYSWPVFGKGWTRRVSKVIALTVKEHQASAL